MATLASLAPFLPFDALIKGARLWENPDRRGHFFNEGPPQVLIALLSYPAVESYGDIPNLITDEDGKEITYPGYAPQPFDSLVSSGKFLYQTLFKGYSFFYHIQKGKVFGKDLAIRV
ncbi:MAG: hypothetical protein ACPL7L_01070 [bacterium]